MAPKVPVRGVLGLGDENKLVSTTLDRELVVPIHSDLGGAVIFAATEVLGEVQPILSVE
jgi:hypothetical protein